MKNIVILLASGSGARIGADVPKQFLQINAKYLFEYSLKTFNDHVNIDEIVIVCHPSYVEVVKNIIKKNSYNKVRRVVVGGETRQESVYNGLFSIASDDANVFIHDAARPFVTNEMINRLIRALESNVAVSTVMPATDTMYVLNDVALVEDIPDRKKLFRVQTPQAFYINTIKKAHYLAQKEKLKMATDDCSLVLHYGLASISTVEGDDVAFKVTTPVDLLFAKSVADNLSIFNSD